jgi:serine O-acetyltransferase
MTVGSPQFPEGYDPNFSGDSRTWAAQRNRALAISPVKLAGQADQVDSVPKQSVSPHIPETTNSLQQFILTFDFDTSSDAEVAECEDAIFSALRREAGELTGSWITAPLARACILKHTCLADALAATLASKLQEKAPGSLMYSVAGGTRAETATAEEALRATMVQELHLSHTRRAVVSDLIKVLVVDPAAEGLLQPMLFFKGFHALATHRVANGLWARGDAASRAAALMLQSRSSELFGVDIHPGATIGNGVMLDHASGVVIGSTARIGSDVYMLHGVTLGATGKPTNGEKRHPTVGSRVVLGAGSTILGDIEVGDDCTVGAGSIVTKDVPAGSTIVGVNNIVTRRKPPPAQDTDSPTDQEAEDDYTWFYDI